MGANHSLTTGDNVDKATVIEREQAYFDDARATRERRERVDVNDSVAEKSFELVDGEELYVGKHTIFNRESELRVIPWQSPAARTFFLSSAVEPLGVRRSRTFAMTRNRIDDFDDTVFADLLSLVEELQRSEPSFDDALLRDLVRDRTGEMQDIVKTIQGGPGAGKTAIALHRVSYLFCNHEELRNDDVLVVGPTPTFSRYIKSLLPCRRPRWCAGRSWGAS